jgi:hypothetical protein
MATYTFQHRETGDVTEISMPMVALDQYKVEHPELELIILSSTKIVSGVMGTRHMDSNFKDLLSNIKRHSGRTNTINTR